MEHIPKYWRAAFHPIRLFSVMLMHPSCRHTLQRTEVCRWNHKTMPKAGRGKFFQNVCAQDSLLQRHSSPPISSILSSNSIPYLRTQFCTVRTPRGLLSSDLFVLCFLPVSQRLVFPKKSTNWSLRTKAAMRPALLLGFELVLCGAGVHQRTESPYLVERGNHC